MRKARLIIWCVLASAVFLGGMTGARATTTTSTATAKQADLPKFIMPQLQITIPALKLTDPAEICRYNDDGSYYCNVPWISQYIQAIYNYSLAIAGILAALVLMAGGLVWLISAGDASKVTLAKELIGGSIAGLIILGCSVMLLRQINPELTAFGPLGIDGRAREEIIPAAEGTGTVSIDLAEVSSRLNVTCGQDSVAQIIDKAKGKITYSQALRNTAAPDGKMYFDCSSFAKYVLKCALNKDAVAYSGNVFQDRTVWDQTLESLQPGDLVGWAPGDHKKNGYGHVIIYMGDGRFGDCNGGSDKAAGKCVANNFTLNTLKNYAAKLKGGKIYMKRY